MGGDSVNSFWWLQDVWAVVFWVCCNLCRGNFIFWSRCVAHLVGRGGYWAFLGFLDNGHLERGIRSAGCKSVFSEEAKRRRGAKTVKINRAVNAHLFGARVSLTGLSALPEISRYLFALLK